jgi:hypothetical protein
MREGERKISERVPRPQHNIHAHTLTPSSKYIIIGVVCLHDFRKF